MKNIFYVIALFMSTSLFAGNFFQGIDLEKSNVNFMSQKKIVLGDVHFTPSSISQAANKWPQGKLYYSFDSAMTQYQKNQFIAGCEVWTSVSNVDCVYRTNQPNYIYVHSGGGNWSYVGMIGGQQGLSIYNWNETYVIAHEIMHALGFAHEQSRPDRDQFVKINWENIVKNAENNFYKFVGTVESTYDYDSLMHYGAFDFSKNGLPVITLLNGDVRSFGQRSGITEFDAEDMRAIYNGDITEPLPRPSGRLSFGLVSGNNAGYNRVSILNIPEKTTLMIVRFEPESIKPLIIIPSYIGEFFSKDFLSYRIRNTVGIESMTLTTYDENARQSKTIMRIFN